MTSTLLLDNDVCICGVARTPIGNLQGALASQTAPALCGIAIRAALSRSGVAATAVEAVYLGCVLGAGLGQAPATQAAALGGLPEGVPATAVNKVCASGMKAVMLGAAEIRAGDAHVVVCGGMESMSRAPYYMTDLRSGHKFGHHSVLDGMAKDGLEDGFTGEPMGEFAERYAQEACISREEQDEYAFASYERSIAAHRTGKFKAEIVPVAIKRGGSSKSEAFMEEDEECFARPVTQASLASLRPSFKAPGGATGTVTAGNASTINDGASALVLVSGLRVRELGLVPLAIIRGWADANQAPARFITSPALAIPKALKHAKINHEQIHFWEINEAFSVVALANMKLLGLPHERVNIYGGAVALGHPLGSSGSRIICTLCSVLNQEGGKYGVAAICNGGGGASAIVLEAYGKGSRL